MIRRYARSVLGPACFWALLVASAFSGIGGMGLMGGGATDAELKRMWQADGVLALAVLIIALAILTWRARKSGSIA
jgi:hypothetical protein